MTEMRRSPRTWAHLIVASYAALAGEGLCPATELMGYPGAVLCHDMSPDPKLVYVNRAAQELWGRNWDDFVGQPSWITAAPEHRADRAAQLAAPGLVTEYRGERVSATGHRFEIIDASIWPVYAESAEFGKPREQVGQAATFCNWQPLD
ncbi:MAG: MEKHLA domain-containing protein [Actinomycetia bacterium]|nr:MEKHLA domain-containing protein [Actinomycetes bacterium]